MLRKTEPPQEACRLRAGVWPVLDAGSWSRDSELIADRVEDPGVDGLSGSGSGGFQLFRCKAARAVVADPERIFSIGFRLISLSTWSVLSIACSLIYCHTITPIYCIIHDNARWSIMIIPVRQSRSAAKPDGFSERGEDMEEMTATEISRLIDWLKSKGMTDAEIIDFLKTLSGK